MRNAPWAPSPPLVAVEDAQSAVRGKSLPKAKDTGSFRSRVFAPFFRDLDVPSETRKKTKPDHPYAAPYSQTNRRPRGVAAGPRAQKVVRRSQISPMMRHLRHRTMRVGPVRAPRRLLPLHKIRLKSRSW